MSELTIWVMDSDLCNYCGALLEYADQCIECGYGWLWFGDEAEHEFDGGREMDDPYYDSEIEPLD